MNLSETWRAATRVRFARRCRIVGLLTLVTLAGRAHTLPVVTGVELPPLIAHVKHVLAALESIGAPIEAAERQTLEAAFAVADPEKSSAAIQHALDHRCLFLVRIDANGRVLLARGIARPEFVAGSARVFLVKVINEAGIAEPLRLDLSAPRGEDERWLEASLVTDSPAADMLTGRRLEYRLLRLQSRETGKRPASFGFYLGREKPERDAMMRLSVLLNILAAP